MCASVCLCFECVFLGRSCVLVCVFVPGACVCWRLGFPKRVVRRFVLIRRRRKERSVPHRVARGTHGYSWGTHGVLTGIHGVLEKSSRGTGEVLAYRGQSQRTIRCTGTACLLRFRASPILRACTARTSTPTPPPSVAPSRPLCPVVCSRASLGTCAVVQVAGASVVQIDVVRARAWGYSYGICGGQWCWRTLPLPHSLTSRARALAGPVALLTKPTSE